MSVPGPAEAFSFVCAATATKEKEVPFWAEFRLNRSHIEQSFEESLFQLTESLIFQKCVDEILKLKQNTINPCCNVIFPLFPAK